MAEIEELLQAAAGSIDWPESDLADRVRRHLTTVPIPKRRTRWALATGLAALVVLVLLGATPLGRQAVANVLEIVGIRIELTSIPDVPPGADLNLGEEVSLEEARSRVSFPIAAPDESPIGEPDAIYHAAIPVGGSVHMVWGSEPRLPAAESSDVGTLYSQFKVTGAELFIKGVDPSIELEPVTVRGQPGFWIEGAHHYLRYRDEDGVIREEFARLAANVLAWDEGGVTHRIETTLSREETLRLADSLRLPG